MNVRWVVIVVLATLILFVPGCGGVGRTAIRLGARGAGSGSSQTKPEDVRFTFTSLDSTASSKLDGYRAKWAEYAQKFGVEEPAGKPQIVAMLDAYAAAHWSKRPKEEDFVRPLGVAIGDLVRKQGGVDWVMIYGKTIALCSANGKVAVAPVDTAATWLKSRTHPIDELLGKVSTAVRETTGEPAQIGFKEDERENDDDMV